MHHIPTTATAVEKLKRAAKKLCKDSGTAYALALDLVAKQNGYAHWKHVTECALRAAEERPVVSRRRSWPTGPAHINAIAMPPDERAMLIPQMTFMEMNGKVFWTFAELGDVGEDREATGSAATLEAAVKAVGEISSPKEWVDVSYQGLVLGSCHGWEVHQHALQMAADLVSMHARLNR